MASAFDRILFFILLAILAARPLISETFESLQISLLAALESRGGPTPAATAVLDSIVLLAAVLALARAGRWRCNRLVAIATLLLLVALLVSTFAAGDKPLAALAGSSLVVAVLGGAGLAALARRRWMCELLWAALLATGLTTAVKCLNQQFWENREVLQQWTEVYKPQLLRQGMAPDDPLLINFERRMQAGEVYGFLAHPNVAGSCLMMWMLAAAGLCLARLRRIREGPAVPVVALALCAVLALALWFTGSRGAIVAGAMGLGLLVVLGVAARWCAGHARLMLALLAAGYLVLVGAAAAYGVARGTLPHPSLAFRWYYWTAAAHAIEDVPLTGLGRGNFTTAYMQYKSPESTEDVRDPHNLWVSLLVELGPLGLAAGLLLCGHSVLRGLRRLAPPSGGDADDRLDLWHAVPFAAGVLFVHAIFAGVDWGGRGEGAAWALDVGLPWPLALSVSLWLVRATLRKHAESRAWITAGLTAAMVACLTHSLLDFPLMTPGGLAVFVLCAVGTWERGNMGTAQAGASRANVATYADRGVPLAVGLAAVVAHMLLVSVPAYQSTCALDELDAAGSAPWAGAGPHPVLAAAERAVQGNRAAAVCRAAAQAVLHVAARADVDDGTRLDWLQRGLAHAGRASARNPRDANNYSLRAALELQTAAVQERLGDGASAQQARRAAAESREQAVRLNPTNPRTRVLAGQVWFELWQRSGDADAARRAAAHLSEALRIDDLRPIYEVMRLPRQERQLVSERLRQLSATTAPPRTRAGSEG